MLLKLVKCSEGHPERHIVVSMMDEGTRGVEMKRYAGLYFLNLKRGQLSCLALLRLIWIIRSERPDVMQGWMYHASLFLTLAGFFSVKPIFWNIRQELVSLHYEKPLTRAVIRLLRRFSLFSPRRIIYNSYASSHQHEAFGFKPVSVVIANGFDPLKFDVASVSDRRRARDSFGLPSNAVVLGQVARFHPMKNQIGFITAVAILLVKNPTLYLLMAGPGVDKENRELIASLDDSGIDLNKIHLLGDRQDLQTIYHALDFLVNPSVSEAFPNVVGEAMSCGVPCIVSDVGDSRRIIGDSGFVFSPGDPRHLSIVLERAMALDPMQYRQRSRAARQRIEASYTISSIYDQYIDLYEEVVR